MKSRKGHSGRKEQVAQKDQPVPEGHAIIILPPFGYSEEEARALRFPNSHEEAADVIVMILRRIPATRTTEGEPTNRPSDL